MSESTLPPSTALPIAATLPDLPLLRDFRQPLQAMVVGASGGIGLALAEQLAASVRVERLFAVARRATDCAALIDLSALSSGRVVLIDCDITDEIQLARMAQQIQASSTRLHLVINTAGMLHAGAQQPEKALSQVTLANLESSFRINAFGPVLLAKALLGLLRHDEPAVLASLSARVGSIGDNRIGGWYSYRAAKAAQNQLMKTLSIELARINRRAIVLLLHPGTTDTGLSKPFQSNVRAEKLFSPAFAANALLNVIAERQPADSGGFYAWDGKPIAW